MRDNHRLFDTNSLRGTLDGEPYDLFVMRDVAYNMKLMATYGRLLPRSDAEMKQRQWTENGQQRTAIFRYHEPFDNHYRYRHAVDDHNNNRHSDISLEETWVTHRWENRVFAFLLGITEVNVWLGYRYFVWTNDDDKLPLLKFRRMLAKALIYNTFLEQHTTASITREKSIRQQQQASHTFATAPNRAKKFSAGQWVCTAATTYPQYVCSTKWCKKKIRTYCKCDPNAWMCQECHGRHLHAVYTSA